jgi:hypothetical protein
MACFRELWRDMIRSPRTTTGIKHSIYSNSGFETIYVIFRPYQNLEALFDRARKEGLSGHLYVPRTVI